MRIPLQLSLTGLLSPCSRTWYVASAEAGSRSRYQAADGIFRDLFGICVVTTTRFLGESW
jgi:hypothetical protein